MIAELKKLPELSFSQHLIPNSHCANGEWKWTHSVLYNLKMIQNKRTPLGILFQFTKMARLWQVWTTWFPLMSSAVITTWSNSNRTAWQWLRSHIHRRSLRCAKKRSNVKGKLATSRTAWFKLAVWRTYHSSFISTSPLLLSHHWLTTRGFKSGIVMRSCPRMSKSFHIPTCGVVDP